jgi:hypothetical protein
LLTDELKVTDVPAQTGFSDGVIEMLTGKSGFTVMFTMFDVAGLSIGQIAFDVTVQVIASSLTGTKVYVASVAPAMSNPFTVH